MLKETGLHYTLCKKMYNTKFTVSARMRLPAFCRVIWKGPPSELERDICPFPPRKRITLPPTALYTATERDRSGQHHRPKREILSFPVIRRESCLLEWLLLFNFPLRLGGNACAHGERWPNCQLTACALKPAERARCPPQH